MKQSQSAILLVLCLLALRADKAFGYLDPGTGSVVLQAVIAALAGAALTIRMYWHKIRSAVARLFSKKEEDATLDH